MGWTYSYVKGQTLWDIPGCLTHPLETDKWDGQVGQWQVPLSLEKGMSHFPNGQSMAMLDMCGTVTKARRLQWGWKCLACTSF